MKPSRVIRLGAGGLVVAIMVMLSIYFRYTTQPITNGYVMESIWVVGAIIVTSIVFLSEK